MAEVLTGTLSFDKGKWKIVFRDDIQQRDLTFIVQKNAFASGFDPKEGDTVEVDFERDNTPQRNAMKVRAKGSAWTGPEIQAVKLDYSRNPSTAPDRSAAKRRNRKGSEPRGEMNTTNQDLTLEFHNPYNFVPAPERIGNEEPLKGELGDREPSGHDRYVRKLFSGRIRVELKVETPLLIPDTARVVQYTFDENSTETHKSFPLRTGLDGRPHLSVTSLKGVVRSAYEAVTNSRFGVFSEHDKRLAFRAPVADGITVVPCRVEKHKGQMCVTLYTGFSHMDEDGGPRIIDPHNRTGVSRCMQLGYVATRTVNLSRLYRASVRTTSTESLSGRT